MNKRQKSSINYSIYILREFTRAIIAKAAVEDGHNNSESFKEFSFKARKKLLETVRDLKELRDE